VEYSGLPDKKIKERNMKPLRALVLFFCLFLALFCWVSQGEIQKDSPVGTFAAGGKNVGFSPALPAGQQSEDKGIGPIKTLNLGPVDNALASKGGDIFQNKCSTCHSLDVKKLGPPLGKVLEDNTPEFIMNFLLNTAEMEEKDPKIQKLIQEYGAPMPVLGLSQDEARAVLEYLRPSK
jgi:mono/diheme cytochrome c family protein